MCGLHGVRHCPEQLLLLPLLTLLLLPLLTLLLLGMEFEKRIMASEANNVKFNFLTPTDPYHAYYRMRVSTAAESYKQQWRQQQWRQEQQQHQHHQQRGQEQLCCHQL